MSFNNFGLSSQILSAIKEKGYTTPTEIQAKTIPSILQKKDILGGAQTGTGKTASFTLPLLQLVSEKKQKNRKPLLRALILVPTRELAAQVHESIYAYGKYLPLKSTVVFGGMNIKTQITKLKKGVDILVATPGRFLDLFNRNILDLSSVDLLVLDEADCMLDMGFIHDIKKIISNLPKTRQNLLFSATFSKAIKQLAQDFLIDPETIEITQNNTVSDSVKQVVYPVDRKRKLELLVDLINKNNWKQVLVFTRTKHGANNLCNKLKDKGICATAIHGDKTQAARTKSLSKFKKGHAQVLVATDIAARGLDIHQLPHVVNFDLPLIANDYVHRIGRTGRAGNLGEAISLFCVDEHDLLKDIERLIKQSITQVVLSGYEIDPSIAPKFIGRKKASGSKKRSMRKGKSFKNIHSSKEPKREGNSVSKKRSSNNKESIKKKTFKRQVEEKNNSFNPIWKRKKKKKGLIMSLAGKKGKRSKSNRKKY